MVPTVVPEAMSSSLFTMMIRIFLFPWNTMCKAVLVARVVNTANLEMVVLAVEVGPRMPGV
jgi:hypothetical protein